MVNLPRLQKRLQRVYYGWWVLSAGTILGIFSGGIFAHSTSVFFRPIRQDLELSSARTSSLFALARVESSIAGPIVGRLVDRFGSRPLIITGGLAAGLGFVLLHWVDSYWAFLAIYVALVATGRSSGLGQAVISAVNRWFVRRKSLAISVCITGYSAGGAIILPLITLGVHTIGWRDVMLYSGVFMCLVVVPLGMVVRHSPESMGIEPEGLNRGEERNALRQGASRAGEGALDFSVSEAFRAPPFWVLLIATTFRITIWGAISVHAVEIMVWKGMDEAAAGFMVSLMFLISIPLRLGAGVMGVRFPLQPLLGAGQIAGGLALVSLLVFDGRMAVYFFLILITMEQGTSALSWVALGNYFGRKSFSTLMGVMSSCFNVGMLISPIYAGWVVDHQGGSYALVMLTFAPFYVLTSLLYLNMRSPALPMSASRSNKV